MKILLVCNAGMSTSIMQLKLKEIARERGETVCIEAIPISEIEVNLKDTDAILLGPQVRFAENDIKKLVRNSIPVICIGIQDFGLMRADNVWNQTMKAIEQLKNARI